MSGGNHNDVQNTKYHLRTRSKSTGNENWLRHDLNTQAAYIDELLIEGATIDEIARDLVKKGFDRNHKGIDIMRNRVRRHLDHLQRSYKEEKEPGHGLSLICKYGIYKFDLS
ncbi:MAG: hypothetical protein AB1599_10230 [Planctomycetota bacterium]